MAGKSMGAQRSDDFLERIEQVLGLRPMRLHTAIEVHERIAKGLPRTAALHLVDSMAQISLDQSIRALNISRRTWDRLKATKQNDGDKPMDIDQSARVWRLAEILTKAELVLGTREEAEAWLGRPALALDGRRPIELLSTPQGAELVTTLLERMEYGVYA